MYNNLKRVKKASREGGGGWFEVLFPTKCRMVKEIEMSEMVGEGGGGGEEGSKKSNTAVRGFTEVELHIISHTNQFTLQTSF